MQSHSDIDQSICQISPLKLEASDAAPIAATLFEPILKNCAKGTVIIHAGAIGDPRRIITGVSRRFLASRRAAESSPTTTRGIGGSRPPTLRGYHATMSDWAHQDAAAAHRFVRERFPGQPSSRLSDTASGGSSSGWSMTRADASGVLLVGAQLGYFGNWPLAGRLRLGLIWYALVPALTSTFGYLPGKVGIGEDLPRGVAEEWARWCKHPDYLISENPDAIARFGSIRRPVLFYSFTDDDFAPRTTVNQLIGRLAAAGIDHRRVHPSEHGGAAIGHFGFFQTEVSCESLWRDAAAF